MSNADMLVEMIRLGEQFGNVECAMMYPNDFLTVEGETKDGRKFTLSLTMKEVQKNGN